MGQAPDASLVSRSKHSHKSHSIEWLFCVRYIYKYIYCHSVTLNECQRLFRRPDIGKPRR